MCPQRRARSRRPLNICTANDLQVFGAEHVEFWKPGQQMSDSETTKAIPARAEGGGWATAEGTTRSGAPRGERCLRGARGGGAGAARSTCSSGNRPGPGGRACARGAWGVCPRRAPRVCCRAGAGVSHGGASLYNGPEARGSRRARQLAAPRSTQRAPAPSPQPPPAAAQSRGRHEKLALRPTPAPPAAAAAAAHAPRRGRRRDHRG
ncbi:prokineticin-2 isoform X1 [Trachypithecus francoisi]|uniref:prokineticin-2 isoform X1 n=1 Tax=Trachypithecus francoisi TaxID=54180 RepID=UPI00141BE3D7|nr:prokineticin-2 isoform X1 [Trachypithecus francoisi]